MNNPRRLSRFDILLGFFRALRSLLPLVIILNINIAKVGLWWVLGIVLAIALSIWLAWLSWSKFSFTLAEDRLVIMRGVLNKEEKIIYYSKIHSVNLQQPLIYRIFKLAKLQIETPGGKSNKAEGELRALHINHALELQKQLKSMANAMKAAKVSDGMEQIDEATPLNAQQVLETNRVPNTLESHTTAYESYQQMKKEAIHAKEIDKSEGHPVKQSDPSLLVGDTTAYDVEQETPDYEYKLSAFQLLKASLTSLNLNIAVIFLLGIYSFSDDIIRIVAPDFEYRKLFEAISGPIIITVVVVSIIAIFVVWLLSVLLYLIKFGDYRITRNKQQISIAYGLLEKKSYIFDQKKIQAVIMDENPLRQMLGFAELKVQVITSDQNKEQLVIHPYIHKRVLKDMITELLPDRNLAVMEQLLSVPRKAWFSYFIPPLIVTSIVIGAGIWIWQWTGLWLLLLYPLIAMWSRSKMVAAGMRFDEKELVLRKRLVNRTTYFVARKHIVTLKASHSPRQRNSELRSISVQVLGSMFPYKIVSLGKEHVEQVWNWYSRSK